MSANYIEQNGLYRESFYNVYQIVSLCLPSVFGLYFSRQRTKLYLANYKEQNKMTLQDLLDKVCNGMSDNKTSQKLGISRQLFSHYRTGRKSPSDEVLDKFIAETGLNPVEVYMAAYAEKVHNPIVADAFRNPSTIAA